MTKAYLYSNFVNRKNRYRDRSLLIRAADHFDMEVNVSGCFVSQTSSYVDIILDGQETPEFLFKLSSVKFTNTDYCDYIAFIDRIEPNNFNKGFNDTTEQYYRLYITIDWWSTIMLMQSEAVIENICSNLEGNVERAHVDDNGDFPLRNTTNEPEISVEKYYTYSRNIFDVDYSDIGYVRNRNFVVVITSDWGDNPDTIIKIGNKEWASSLNAYLMPLRIDEDKTLGHTKFLFKYNYSINGEEQDSVLIDVDTMPTIDALTATKVVAMYLVPNIFGEISWTDYNKDGHVYIDTPTLIINVGDLKEPLTLHSTGFSGFDEVSYWGAPLPPYLKPYEFNFNEIDEAITPNALENIPSSYAEYLNHYIKKADYCPYNTWYFEKGGSQLVIPLAYYWSGTEYMFSISVNGYGTGYIFKYGANVLFEGENEYISILDSSSFTTAKEDDPFTRMQMWTSFGNSLMSVVGSSVPMIAGIATGNPLLAAYGTVSTVKSIGNLPNAIASTMKQIRDGASGVKTTPSAMSNIIDTFRVVNIRPESYCYRTLRKDLALYGYNTYLHPHEVLSGHRRKYFNYIKTNNALVNISGYSQEVKMHIEEMFNNGVWLWNDIDEFGNYEVPNYPIIMEEQ